MTAKAVLAWFHSVPDQRRKPTSDAEEEAASEAGTMTLTRPVPVGTDRAHDPGRTNRREASEGEFAKRLCCKHW